MKGQQLLTNVEVNSTWSTRVPTVPKFTIGINIYCIIETN